MLLMPMHKNDGRSSRQDCPEVGNKILCILLYQFLITGVTFLSQNTENLKNLCYSLASPDVECCVFACGAGGECGVGHGGQFGGVGEAGFMPLPSSHRMP